MENVENCCTSSISCSSIPVSVPSSDHLLRYLVAVLAKGGSRKVPTVVSKSLICCSRKNVGTGIMSAATSLGGVELVGWVRITAWS